MTAPRLEGFPLRRRRLRPLKQVPVLPSLVTLGNVFFGFLAIAKVADALRQVGPGTGFLDPTVVGLFEVAAILVFIAMVFDALDGRIARLTNQATPFGAQLDSMADMVTFGVAPAFMAKVLIELHTQGPAPLLPAHPKLYYVAAAIYVLCAALRLARFNVETGPQESEHREFRGLPSPAAAAVICSVIWFLCTQKDEKQLMSRILLSSHHYDWLVFAMPVGLALLGLLMVSRIPYPHLIYAVVRGRHSFPFLASLVVVIGVAAVEWQFALVTCTLSYVAWGILLGLYRLVTTGRLDRRGDGDDDGDLNADPSLN
jgi:CDP-diacylglycerol--serine O-phosphatidyltransferase